MTASFNIFLIVTLNITIYFPILNWIVEKGSFKVIRFDETGWNSLHMWFGLRRAAGGTAH